MLLVRFVSPALGHDRFVPRDGSIGNVKRVPILVVAAILILSASPASASCVEPPPLEERLGEARTVFVGTIASTSNRDRNAAVRVEKIWLGQRLPARVEVLGGEQSANVSSSVDREWEEGARYLFVLDDTTAPFRDDACSATTEYTSRIAALEPDGAIAPLRSTSGGFSPWIFVGLGLLALGVLQARRAARRAHSLEI